MTTSKAIRPGFVEDAEKMIDVLTAKIDKKMLTPTAAYEAYILMKGLKWEIEIFTLLRGGKYGAAELLERAKKILAILKEHYEADQSVNWEEIPNDGITELLELTTIMKQVHEALSLKVSQVYGSENSVPGLGTFLARSRYNAAEMHQFFIEEREAELQKLAQKKKPVGAQGKHNKGHMEDKEIEMSLAQLSLKL